MIKHINILLENLPGLILVYGAAVVVAVLIIRDLLKRKVYRPSCRWLVIVLLSVYQVGCWAGLENFNRAFGGQSGAGVYALLLIALVVCWTLCATSNTNGCNGALRQRQKPGSEP